MDRTKAVRASRIIVNMVTDLQVSTRVVLNEQVKNKKNEGTISSFTHAAC